MRAGLVLVVFICRPPGQVGLTCDSLAEQWALRESTHDQKRP